MWKRIDNELYYSLKRKMNSGFVPMVGAYAFWFALTGLLLMLKLLQYREMDGLAVGFLLVFITITAVLVILTVICSKKEKEIKSCLESNHAHYTDAVIAKKSGDLSSRPSHNGDDLFDIIVSVGRKDIKVKCTIEVFTECQPGDKVYLVDLLGEEAANRRTCIAVKTVEAPEPGYTREQFGEIVDDIYEHTGNRISGEVLFPADIKTPSIPQSSHIMTDNERAYLTAKERKHLIPTILPFPILVLFCVFLYCVSHGIILLEPQHSNIDSVSSMMADKLFVVFVLISILCFIISLGFFVDIMKTLSELKNPNLHCQRYLLKDINTAAYHAGRKSKTYYYYTCADKAGNQAVLEGYRRSGVKKGDTVIAVFFKPTDVKLYT